MSEEEKIIDLENEISFLKDALCEKQKEIEELKKYKQYYETTKIIWNKNDYISKDKIKAEIKELEKHLITKSDEFTINVLKGLIGE